MYDGESWCLGGDLYKCPVLFSGQRMMMMMMTKYTGYSNYKTVLENEVVKRSNTFDLHCTKVEY